MRVLVTEKIADGGLQRLRDAGHEVDVQEGLSPEQLLEVIPGAHALIIRSATQVTAEALAAGTDLIVVGRAGIGLDNVDVAAATERGVMVVNAPQSNTLSAAEHTMALLLSQARNVPQASAALKAGRWERSKWTGVELSDKTLGIIGLGRIGKLVAQRALAFGMKLVAYDPFVSEDRARQLSVELLSLEDLMARSGLHHAAPGQDTRDRRSDRRRHAGAGQAVAAGHQRRPRRHHRRAGAGRRRSPTARSPVLRSTCSPPSRPPSRRCSSSTRSSSPRTWVRPPPRRRTRRATRSPTWSSWRSPATSCRTR